MGTREWKRLDNAKRVITRFFKIYISGGTLEDRIDIHTQTQRKAQSANTYLNANQHQSLSDNRSNEGDEDLNAEDIMIDDDDDDDEDDEDDDDVSAVGLYQHKIDLDLEWKTQSLPSLGRVSSEQTLESSGDEFSALRRAAPTRMLKSKTNNQTNKGTDEEDQVEDQEIDTNHYDGNILHHQHKPHDETDKGEIINPPHYHQQTSLVKRYFLENIFCINDSRSIGARYFQRFSNCIVVN